jgi:hypothetical protein
MKNLYHAPTAQDVMQRIASLRPESERQWGKMNVAQALAHCSVSMEWALGDRTPKRMFVGRILGMMVKPFVFRNDDPMRRNSPTAEELIIRETCELGTERQRLLVLIDRFTITGPCGCTTKPHSFFGRLTPEEWAILMYKHLDHHLRQFSA